MTLQWTIETYETLSSTQDQLKKEYNTTSGTLQEGTCIHALSQTGGKGRHGRSWEGGQNNLSLSFLLSPHCGAHHIGQLSLTIGLAVCDTINTVLQSSGKSALLKWPNDILIDGKKCCGILIDTVKTQDQNINDIIVGIGVNLNSSPMQDTENIQRLTNHHIDVHDFRDILLMRIASLYAQWRAYGFDNLRHDWLGHALEKGSPMHVKIGAHHTYGCFDTIDSEGNLILTDKDTGQKKTISSGDVFLTEQNDSKNTSNT